ncbi:MAG: T9SS type A sorting domain-containing protein [Chitinophagales bacterium]
MKKNNELLNFITDADYTIADTGIAKDFLAVKAIDKNKAPIIGENKTFQLTDLGWQTPNNSTISALNEGLTPNYYYTLRYIFETITGESILIHTAPTEIGFNNYVFASAPLHYCIPHTQRVLYRNLDNNWTFDNNNFSFPWDINFENSNDLIYEDFEEAIITIHFSFIETLNYFKEVHKNDNWYDASHCDEIGYIRYKPNGNALNSNQNFIEDSPVSFRTPTHELGHRFNQGISTSVLSNGEFSEGFADIWATNIEKFAFDLEKPEYRGGLNRNMRTFLLFGSSAYNSFGQYQRLRVVTHQFYLLSEPSAITNKPICGIGDEVTARIITTALEISENTDDELGTGGLESYLLLRDYYQDAVDLLTSEQNIYPIFANPNYIKAQIRNAWAEVGIGEPDFEVQTPSTLDVCKGENISLSAISEVGNLKWYHESDNQTHLSNTGIYEIVEAEPTDAGVYTVKITYDISNVPNETACILTKEVAVSVKHIVINEGNEPLQVCKGDTQSLTLTKHGDVSNIHWETPENANYAINTTTKSLTISSMSAEDAGIYRVVADCLGDDGTSIVVTDEIEVKVVDILDDIVEITMTMVDGTEIPNGGFVCSGEVIHLNASLTSIGEETQYELTWTNDNGSFIAIPNGFDTNVIPEGTTTYQLSVRNKPCNQLKIFQFSITTSDGTVNLGNQSSYCEGDNLVVSDEFTDHKWYILDENDTPELISINPSLTFTQEGTNTYRLEALDGDDCVVIGQKEITVSNFLPSEVPIVTPNKDECQPSSSIDLDQTNPTIYMSWEWKEGQNTLQESNIPSTAPNLSVNHPGIYTLIVQSQIGGCEFKEEYEVTYADMGILGNIDVKPNDPLNDYWKPSSLTADNIITIEGTVTVKQGAILAIEEGAIVEFIGENSGIVVERGGRLEVNNVTFRASECPNNIPIWKGLRVEGDYDKDHPTNYINAIENHPNHGLAYLKYCIIKDAEIAIDDKSIIVGSKYGGGGLIDVFDCLFENNRIGIHFSLTSALSENKIIECSFINSNGFGDTNDSDFLKPNYIHIRMSNVADSPKIILNHFETTASNLDNEHKGKACSILSSNFKIGEDCEGNTFKNLYEGVYVMNFGAALTQQIFDNTFTNVHKGITLNKSNFADVSFNIFEEMPEGFSSNYLSEGFIIISAVNPPNTYNHVSHGILTESSSMSEILGNKFYSSITGEPSNFLTRGLVIKNSAYDSQQVANSGLDFYVEDNTFDGVFPAATQFEQNNIDLGFTINCHTYTDNTSISSVFDWYLHTDCVLPVVGNCLDETEFAYRGSWDKGVYESSGTLTAINWRNTPPPITTNTGNGSNLLNPCGESQSCIPLNNPCGGKTPPNPPIHPIEPKDERRYLVQQIQYKLANSDHTEVINLLEQQQEVWSDKILAATYLQKRDITKTMQTLNRIPTNTTDNQAFVNMITFMAQDQVLSNETQIRHYATDISLNPRTNILAQSILSTYFEEHYIRNAALITNSSSKTATSLFEKKWLKILPNPVKDKVNIHWIETPKEEEKVEVRIYNGIGQQVNNSTIHVDGLKNSIDVGFLKSGVYYIQINGENNIYGFDKLVIVR